MNRRKKARDLSSFPPHEELGPWGKKLIAWLKAWLRKHNPGDFSCSECGEQELCGYMVHDQVWYEAGAEKDDLLHLGCLEKWLTRPLTRHDFIDAPINREILWLMDRKA